MAKPLDPLEVVRGRRERQPCGIGRRPRWFFRTDEIADPPASAQYARVDSKQ